MTPAERDTAAVKAPRAMAARHAMELAAEAAKAEKQRLAEVYGLVPATVYFVQRRPDGPVKIGWAQRLAGRISEFYRECPDPVIVHVAVPGSRATEAWFHRRHRERLVQGEWYEEPTVVVADARAFSERHAAAFSATGDRDAATVATISAMDQVLGDMYRLYCNGSTQIEIAQLSGMSHTQVRGRLNTLRALGFDIPHRRGFARRGDPSVRLESPTSLGRVRLLG